MKLNHLVFSVLFLSFFLSYGQTPDKKVSFINASQYEKDFELVHTKLEVSFDIPNELLFGKEWLQLHPYYYDTDNLVLDAKGMTLKTVTLEGRPLDFQYDGEKIDISLGKNFSKADTLNIFIEYTADPSKVKQTGSKAITSARGLYFIDPKGLNDAMPTQIWTQGETESSSCWFPTIDSPGQKTTQELAIRVPEKYLTLSNGELQKQTSHENGDRTDYWVMNQKHAPYLFFMGIGEFALVKDEWRGKEVNYYVEKEYEDIAKTVFGKTPKMMDFFSEITGIDFVWDKYSQMVLRQFVSGAMENTTAVSHADMAYQDKGDLIDGNKWEPVIAHELFHHWFGDLVTTENWSNISLNESFANYSEYLWLLHEYGYERAEEHRIQSVEAYMQGGNEMKKLVRFDYENKEDVFDLVSYNKGGAVLHMLKNYLGEKAFYDGIHLYLTENMYGTAEVPQLRMAFERVSGKDLNWFFDQWYYGGGHPVIYVNNDYNVLEKTVTVTLRQRSSNFYFPVVIDIYEKGKKKRLEFFVDDSEKSFTFTYEKQPDWIHVDANHVLLADITVNYTLRDYKFQLENAPHFADRLKALEELSKHQSDKKIFEMIVDAFYDKNYQVSAMALDKIDLSGKYAKSKVIKKIESIAKNAENNTVKAKAIKTLGKLVYFDYQRLFEQSFNSPSNQVKGAALEALYYLDEQAAISRAKKLPNSVKKTIAYPLAKMYVKAKDEDEIEFVSSYIVQGMYLAKEQETKDLFKGGFQWVSSSNNIKAIKNITDDIVAKGKQYKQYNFDKEAIKLLRSMVSAQDAKRNSNKREIVYIINEALEELIQ
ncbi:M1 family metallopeptidase [Flavicella marina]|uniref:M1 family metallopeptidase n=1 Tax=Flavicella marina TaxID=1475951 RepID=UPI0012647210|nr:M1 family metallopeptidase [Flavicella marina]